MFPMPNYKNNYKLIYRVRIHIITGIMYLIGTKILLQLFNTSITIVIISVYDCFKIIRKSRLIFETTIRHIVLRLAFGHVCIPDFIFIFGK